MKRSRQSYYKALGRQRERASDSESLLGLVQPVRQLMPRLGGRKMYFMLQQALAEKAIKIGRDRFFDWLREQDLLTVSKPNQLWVSDITYLRTRKGFCYLALITDAYSRKIVGYDVSDSLELEGCRRALKHAMQTASNLSQLVHHSDRGIQYCSHQYTDLLRQSGVRISMASKGNCYQNALAERVNGILKDEFNLDTSFKNKFQAIAAVHQSIYIYNQHRPHWSIGLLTPNERHAA